MKLALETIKILLLLAIAVLIGMGLLKGQDSSKVNLNKSSLAVKVNEEPTADAKQRENDLRKIMEHRLIHLFKFPENVKFQDTKYHYTRVYQDHGIKVVPEEELEFATLCGQYAAPNAMAVYGAMRPFYAEIAVNNESKGLTSEVWLDIDGDIKKLITSTAPITVDGDRTEFEERYSKYCGDTNTMFMGAFKEYEMGYTALTVKLDLMLMEDLVKHPGAEDSLRKCSSSGASYTFCVNSEYCKQEKQLGKSISEGCEAQHRLCQTLGNDAECEAMLAAANKTEKSTKQ
ncbi:hypothetical protein [Ferrimonas kyonanensis]|uniref:hypothetical protein n=1 Tax=Ferrimonas kyonanensis TaxID=364763 RepID=UPI0012EB7AC6|nr:hypothetical protein [Ferrimonas kyonanensis]